MQIDDLRDTLAIEIARELVQDCAASLLTDKETENYLSRTYPMADAVLSHRNVSKPIITRHD